MARYNKGARWERAAKEALEKLGLQVYRVAGSKGVDLVIPRFTVEVKFRQELPKTIRNAGYYYIQSLSGFCARPLWSIIEPNMLPTETVEGFGPWENLVPENGFLLLKSPGVPWIILGRLEVIKSLVGGGV